jgi:transposase-like protein
VHETYVKLAGNWGYLYRAVDQYGQVIDVYASSRRDGEAARRFFQRARNATGAAPTEVITDRAPTYLAGSRGNVARGVAPRRAVRQQPGRVRPRQLKRRLRPMRGIKTVAGLRIVAAGHAFVQNLRRGHYEIAADHPRHRRLAAAFGQLATAI